MDKDKEKYFTVNFIKINSRGAGSFSRYLIHSFLSNFSYVVSICTHTYLAHECPLYTRSYFVTGIMRNNTFCQI